MLRGIERNIRSIAGLRQSRLLCGEVVLLEISPVERCFRRAC